MTILTPINNHHGIKVPKHQSEIYQDVNGSFRLIKTMHGHFNLPPFSIIEKTRTKIKGNRVFATTTSWVMEPTCDTLKYRYGNEIGHPQSRTEISKQ